MTNNGGAITGECVLVLVLALAELGYSLITSTSTSSIQRLRLPPSTVMGIIIEHGDGEKICFQIISNILFVENALMKTMLVLDNKVVGTINN